MVKMSKFGFVILNYNSYKYCLRCIRSINSIQGEFKEIILVDNSYSKNERNISRISKLNINNLTILISQKNVGYARGNNIGIKYAREVLKCDFVCVINPDSVVLQKDFIDKILVSYKKFNFSVCGPRIIDEVGKGHNPLGGYHESLSYWSYSLVNNIRIYFVKYLYLYKIREFLSNYVFKKEKKLLDVDFKYKNFKTHLIDTKSDYTLSGACLIFSPSFFEYCQGFCSKTFLFSEEYILTYVLHHLNLKLLYLDEVTIKHYSGKSTDTLYKTDRDKVLFLRKLAIKNDFTLIKILFKSLFSSDLTSILASSNDEYFLLNKNSFSSKRY